MYGEKRQSRLKDRREDELEWVHDARRETPGNMWRGREELSVEAVMWASSVSFLLSRTKLGCRNVVRFDLHANPVSIAV